MPLSYHAGIPFAPTVYEAAQRHDVLDRLAALATRYRSQHGGLVVAPARGPRSKPGQVRLRAADLQVEAVLDAVGVVVGFSRVLPAPESPQGAQVPTRSSQPVRSTSAGRGGGPRGPRTWDGLFKMLREGGYEVEHTGRHLAVLSPTGGRVYTVPTSASDRRALLNAISDLRRVTGLSLRA